jgi:hypothetical protein
MLSALSNHGAVAATLELTEVLAFSTLLIVAPAVHAFRARRKMWGVAILILPYVGGLTFWSWLIVRSVHFHRNRGS